jgi:N-methylhydantoinase A
MPVPRDALERLDAGAIAGTFHAEHNRLYGYDLRTEGTGLELINVRLVAIGRTARPPLPRLEEAGRDPSSALKGSRRAFVPESDEYAEVPVYDGHALLGGNAIQGPALVDRTDTTIFVSAAYAARVDEHGSIVMEPGGGAAEDV